MAAPPALAQAFSRLQVGDALGALAFAEDAARAEPGNARGHLATGIALRLLGRLPEAQASLERSAQLDPLDYAAAYEGGVVQQLRGNVTPALVQFQRAAILRPTFFAAHFSAGLLQFERREWGGAITSFRAAHALEPRNAEALLNLGQALIEEGDAREGMDAIAQALAIDPAHAAGRHAMGWALHRAGDTAAALPHFQAAAAAEPRNADWLLSVAKALGDLRRHAEAEAAYVHALAADPERGLTLRTFGKYSVSRGSFPRAATLFAEALRQAPGDPELPLFLAQVELLRGRWREGWSAYAKRDERAHFEQLVVQAGRTYRVPALAEVAGREWTIVGEQGLGDTLFFLRYVASLRTAGARLRFAGDARLHPLLRRTGMFESLVEHWDPTSGEPLLAGDLAAMARDPIAPSLRIAPEPVRVSRWRAALEAMGPRPWIGVTWRAGTPRAEVTHALHKSAPLEPLFAALRPLGGTVVALQRGIAASELVLAGAAFGATVLDLSGANEELEDALALVSLLDRHVGVSNTNTHLAALAAATADVLMPFPPEWRWRSEGDSPWFPGFRVHRQSVDGDWAAAMQALSR